MAKPIPSTANLAVGAKNNGYTVLEVLDGPAGKYVVETEAGTAATTNVQSGAHAFGTTGTGTSASFSVTFPTPFANPPTVEVSYQWNYHATNNGTALNPVIIVDSAPSTTGFNYRIIGGRNLLDKVLWTAVDPLATIAAGNTILTERAITGSITSTGYDRVTVPYQIPLTAGQVLDTVTLNGVATTDFDASTGIVRITPAGAPIAVAHTTKAGATFSALQWVGEFTPPDNTVYDTLATINTGINFNKCDYIEWQFRLTSDLRAISSWVPKIVGGTTPTMEASHGTGQISSFIANATDALAGKLTNVDCHGVAFEVIKIRGWALGLNKVVVPTASTERTPCSISINGGAAVIVQGGTSGRLFVTVPAGQMVDIAGITQSAGLTVSVADPFSGALEVGVTEGTATGTITVPFIAAVGTNDYLHARVNSGQAISVANTDLQLTSLANQGVTITGNININLKPFVTYRIVAALATDGTGTDRGTFQIYNATAAAFIGTAGFLMDVSHTTIQSGQPMAVAYITPTVATQVRVRVAVNKAGTVSSYAATSFVSVDVVDRDYFVTPVGMQIANAYGITVNGGANGNFAGHEGIGPETFYISTPVDQEIDAFPVVAGVTLRNRQAGMFSVDRAVGAGNLALTGVTFRNLGVKAKYFGTADNQAGDSGATNGGHTFTQRLARGNGIATANHSTFTLSGGIYRIRFGVTQHYGNGAWRNTGLLVNGTEINNVYSGSDTGNWESGGDLEWIVDAISASQTVQMRRVGSSNNGNCDCWLSIEREEGFALPEGYQTRQACVLTTASGSFIGGATTANIPTDTGQYVGFTIPNGQILQSVTSNNANVTVGAPDPMAGTVFVTVGNGATAATLTPTFVLAPAIRGLTAANAGVAVNIGTIRLTMPTGGNRSWQVQSNTGANLTLQVQNLWSNGGNANGVLNMTATPGTWTYFNSSWNFTSAGDWQNLFINDVSSGRWYNIRCEVGPSYNNCSYSWFEIV